MGGHYGCHACGGEGAEGLQIGLDLGEAARVFRPDVVAVAGGKAVPGEMFAAGFHAAFCQPALQSQGQGGYGFRLPVEAAVADNGAALPVQIQHRCKRHVHAAGSQFGG